jgi:hypothetical protein
MNRKGILILAGLLWLGTAGFVGADEYEGGDYIKPSLKLLPAMAERFEIFGNAGIAYYAMGEYNKGVALSNDYQKYYGLGTYEPLSSGNTYGGGAAYWITNNLSVGAQVSFLEANSEAYPFKGYHYRDCFSALEIGGMVRYGGMLGRELLGLVGAGVGSLSLDGAYHEVSLDGYDTTSFKLTGSCVSYQAFGEVDYFLTSYAALGVDLGYRVANVTNVRANSSLYHDQKLYIIDGAELKLDYSGVFCRAVLKFFY